MTELKVEKMTCNHCAHTVTTALKSIDPAATVDVDLANKRVRVESDRPLAELTKALHEAGYPATA